MGKKTSQKAVKISADKYDKYFDALDLRFPNAKFVVSCFDNIDEIENKILTKDEHIIIEDKYITEEGNLYDTFVVNKLPDKSHIYYCDVIDELIKNNFVRNDCNHKFLESIGRTNSTVKSRNDNSVKSYGFFWGS